MTRLNCCKGVIGNGHVIESSGAEERAFSSIGFSDYANLHKDHEALAGSDSGYSYPGALCAIANVERDQQRRNLFNGSRIVQTPSVDSPGSRKSLDQSENYALRVLVIAANQYVTVDTLRRVAQHLCTDIVES